MNVFEIKRPRQFLVATFLATILSAGLLVLAAAPAAAQILVIDLSVTKSDSPDPVVAGEDLTYTVVVTNNDPLLSATGVTLTDKLPPGTTYLSASSTAGTCTESDGTVTCNIGDLAASTSATVTIVVTPTATASATISNTATVAANESDLTPENNSDTEETTVNHVPDAVDDAVTTNEDNAVTLDVLANDTDPDGDTLAVQSNTQPQNGSVTLNQNYSFTYTPNRNFDGTDSFQYTVGDGRGGTDTATVNVTVNAVNDAPGFTKGADQNVQEDAGAQSVSNWATAISAGPSNESGQTVNFDVTNNNNALFSVQPAVSSDGTLSYTPAADASGTATVSVKIKDDGGTANGGVDESPVQTFTITVTPVNDAPVLDLNGNESGGDYSATFTEDDGAVGIVGASGSGALTVADVDDDNMESATAKLTNNPDGTAEALSVDTTGTSVHATSYDSTTGVLSLSGSANKAEYQQVLRTVKYDNASQNPSTADRIVEFVVNDGDLDSTKPNSTVAVISVNDAPVAQDGSATTDEDNSKLVTLSATDVDNSSLTYKVASLPTNGKLYKGASTTESDEIKSTDGLPIALSGNQVTYVPNVNYNGADSFKFVANDGTVNSIEATISVTVNPVNDPPKISDVTDKTIEKDTSTGLIPFTVGDADTPVANLTLTRSSSNTTLVPNANIVLGGTGANRTVKVTPAAGKTGRATITVRVSDGSAQVTDTFVLTVQDTKAPKVIGVAPRHLATGVSPKANVIAAFSEAMKANTLRNPDTLRSATFRLVRKNADGTNTRVAARVTYNATTKKAILNPDRNLRHGATYIATVTTRAKDLSGNALLRNKVWRFTVR